MIAHPPQEAECGAKGPAMSSSLTGWCAAAVNTPRSEVTIAVTIVKGKRRPVMSRRGLLLVALAAAPAAPAYGQWNGRGGPRGRNLKGTIAAIANDAP